MIDQMNLTRLPPALRHGTVGDGRLFAIIAVPLLLVYLVTATWSQPYHIDPLTNVLSAWSLGSEGRLTLDDHTQLTDPDYFRNIAWVVPAGDTAASQYPPGAMALAAPLYAVWPDDAVLVEVGGTNRPDVAPVAMLHPSLAPAAIAAAAVVAVAIGLLGVTFRRLGATPVVALGGAYLAGLGTSAWSVAADKLWQHGPGMMWIALAALLSQSHMVGSGFAYGAAILTRPPTAVVAAATGLFRSWHERSWRPAAYVAIGATTGLGLFLLYNHWVFGSASINAGYGSGFQDQALSGDLPSYAKNLFLAAFSATRGLFIWSPFLVVLLPGLRAGWRAAPAWARGAALGGLLYLLLQYKANRFSGGGGFFAYRYPLEALMAAGPVLLFSFREWVAPRPWALRLFSFTARASVAIHAVGAVL